MAELDTGQAILANLLRRSGEIAPTSTDVSTADHLIDAKLAVTEAVAFISAYRPWRWARIDPPQQVVSIAKIDVTQVSIVGSTVTLSADPGGGTTSMAGRKYFVDGDAIPARISAHTIGASTMTLQAAYTGLQTGSAAAHVFTDEITLPVAVLAYPDIQEMHIGDYLTILPEPMFRNKYPRNIQGSIRANYATFITATKIRIAPWTNDARLFEYVGNAVPAPLTFDGVAGTDTPTIPRWSRKAIANRALQTLFPDKRDARLKEAQAELQDMLSMLEKQDMTFARHRSWIPKGSRIAG